MTVLKQPDPAIVRDPAQLYQYLRNAYSDMQEMVAELQATKNALAKMQAQQPSGITTAQLRQIRDALSAGGVAQLSLNGLVGQSSTPQLAGPVVAADLAHLPTASHYLDGTLAVTTSSPYTVYFVDKDANGVHKWTALIGIPADMMTTDTTQTVTGAKTFNAAPTLGNNVFLQAVDSGASVRGLLLWDASDVVHIRNNALGTGGRIVFEPKAGGAEAGEFTADGHFALNNGFRFITGQATNSSPYTITNTSVTVGVLVTGPMTVNMPASPTVGDLYIIQDVNGGATINNITVQGNGHNIDGAASYVINTAWGTLRVWYTGSIWKTW